MMLWRLQARASLSLHAGEVRRCGIELVLLDKRLIQVLEGFEWVEAERLGSAGKGVQAEPMERSFQTITSASFCNFQFLALAGFAGRDFLVREPHEIRRAVEVCRAVLVASRDGCGRQRKNRCNCSDQLLAARLPVEGAGRSRRFV